MTGDIKEETEIGQRFFQQMMDIFILPAIEEIQSTGSLPRPAQLSAAQVIFFPDGRKPQVRINREVTAIGKVRLLHGVTKHPGDPIHEHELQGLEGISLPEKEFPDCGHATFIRFGDTWTVAFDFRYNKTLARQHFSVAEQFFRTAEHALSNKHWSAFADNLFSAAELAARANLLLMPDKKFREKATHKAIHHRYNRFADLGNVDPEHVSAFNKLYGIRDKARYLRQPFTMSQAEAKTLLDAVRTMLEWGKQRTGPESKF
jgi:hypothetical protein